MDLWYHLLRKEWSTRRCAWIIICFCWRILTNSTYLWTASGVGLQCVELALGFPVIYHRHQLSTVHGYYMYWAVVQERVRAEWHISLFRSMLCNQPCTSIQMLVCPWMPRKGR